MNEFKEIRGYEGLYAVDTSGNVYSLIQNSSRRKGKLKGYLVNGYRKVNLYDVDGHCTKKYVHRLVAETFIDNPENLPEVNHIDCNHSNNDVSNLEWCSRMENLEHSYSHGLKRQGEKHGMHKLNEQQVREIRNSQIPQCKLAQMYEVSQSTISAIKTKRLWKEVV